MILKVVYGKEIHLISNVPSYRSLIQTIKTSFKDIPQFFTISYTDQQGDQVSINTQQDFNILSNSPNKEKVTKVIIQQYQTQKIISNAPLSVQKTGFVQIIQDSDQPNANNSEFTQIVVENNQSQKQAEQQKVNTNSFETVTHIGTKCHNCQLKQIIGNRYKCMVCQNYDLCEKCQSLSQHPHPFIKLKHMDYTYNDKKEKKMEQEKKQKSIQPQKNIQPQKKQNIINLIEQSNNLIHIPEFNKKSSDIDIDQLEFGSKEQKNQVYAQYLSSIVGADPQKMLKFVQKNQGINASLLATKWFQSN